MDIWGILGIEQSAGIDEIRAAYSEKVKEFHPEDDPEGFMRVREAYKAAIRMTSGCRPAGFAAPPPERPASRPARTAETPPSPAFDFSELGGQGHERTESKPPEPAFDFSGLSGQKPEYAESKPPEPAFDFSDLSGQEPEHAESKPPEPAFDFSGLSGQEPERTEGKPSRPTFDFSGLSGQEPERTESKPPEPAFDFSGLGGQETERTESRPPEPAFDFSKLEQDAAMRSETEEQLADSFIAQATKLYESYAKKEGWKILFAQPALEALKRSEYFVWLLLDFLAATPEIPAKVRAEVLDPFIDELRIYWHGTPLWDEFDVATQSYISKGLKKASRIFLAQLACVALPILLFVVTLWLTNRIIPINVDSARELLSSWHASVLTGLISLAASSVAGFVMQVTCFRRICNLVNRGVSGRVRIRRSRVVLVLVSIVSAQICLIAAVAIADTSTYTDDIKQIDEGRLSEGVIYIYSPIERGIEVDTIHIADVEDPDSLYEDLYIPKGLNFDPDPSHLRNEDLSVADNLANGMKAYRITFTDQELVIVSITEEP